MVLQTEIRMTQAFGVPGEFYDTSPRRATSYVLAGRATIGRACTLTATDGRIAMGGSGAFAGILMAPKQHVRPGTEFAATMDLPAETQVEAADRGRLVVILKTAANPGDLVIYDTSTGELSTTTDPDESNLASGMAFVPGCRVALFTVTAGGPAVIEL